MSSSPNRCKSPEVSILSVEMTILQKIITSSLLKETSKINLALSLISEQLNTFNSRIETNTQNIIDLRK